MLAQAGYQSAMPPTDQQFAQQAEMQQAGYQFVTATADGRTAMQTAAPPTDQRFIQQAEMQQAGYQFVTATADGRTAMPPTIRISAPSPAKMRTETPPVDKRLQLAMQEKRIEKHTSQEMLTITANMLMRLYVMAGFTMPCESDMTVLIGSLTNRLIESYALLTPGEVKICMERGVEGDWGDFVGLNMRTFSGWLKRYTLSDFRYRAVLVTRQPEPAKPLEAVTEAEKERSSHDFLQRAYQHYLAGGDMQRLMTARIYRMLQERNLICHTPEEKWAAMRRFENWRPQTRLPLDEVLLLQWRKSEAMNYLLTGYFADLQQKGMKLLPL